MHLALAALAVFLLLLLLLLVQVYRPPLQGPREPLQLHSGIVALRAPGVVYMRSVLPRGLLAAARHNALQYRVVRTQLGWRRTSGAVSAQLLRSGTLGRLYRCPQMRELVAAAVEEAVDIAPAEHPHSCSLLTYSNEGDHIAHHYDVNYYRGRTFTALLTLVNRDSRGRCCSGTQTCYDDEGHETCLRTEENSLLVMEGARVRHRASALGKGEHRVVLSMTFTTDSSQRGWQAIGRYFKDSSFGL